MISFFLLAGYSTMLTVYGVLDSICCDDDAVVSLCVAGLDLAFKHDSSGILCGKKCISHDSKRNRGSLSLTNDMVNVALPRHSTDTDEVLSVSRGREVTDFLGHVARIDCGLQVARR